MSWYFCHPECLSRDDWLTFMTIYSVAMETSCLWAWGSHGNHKVTPVIISKQGINYRLGGDHWERMGWLLRGVMHCMGVLPSILQYKTHPIRKHKCFSSRLAVIFAQSIEARCWVENEDVVGAAPTGDAPTTSEWSTILLHIKVWLILETLR